MAEEYKASLTTEYNTVDVVAVPIDLPPYETEDYDYFDEKDMAKYIKDLELFVRRSFEYSAMVQYLREYMNMRSCAFLPAVTNEYNTKIRIEIHHSPITLYEICSIIFRKRQFCGQCLDIEAVAFEVLYVHYTLMVGLIPLSETVHELVHNQYICVPVTKVYGYYNQFLAAYEDIIKSDFPELLDKMNMLQRLAQDNEYNEYLRVLEKKYITVDMQGTDQLRMLNDAQSMLKNRLREIREQDNVGTTNYNITSPQNTQVHKVVNPFTHIDRK